MRPSPRRAANRFFASPEFTSILALVTVILTAMFSFCTQYQLLNQQSSMKLREDTRNQMVTTISGAYDLLAGTLQGLDDRLRYAVGSYQQLSAGQLDTMVSRTNAADARWRVEREKVEMLVYLYFGGGKGAEEWQRTRAIVQIYADCARQAYLRRYNGAEEPPGSCEEERKDAHGSLNELREVLAGEFRKQIES